MKAKYMISLIFVLALGLYGCAAASNHSGYVPEGVNQEAAKPMPENPAIFELAPEEPATNYMNCYVQVWEGENYTGKSVILRPDDLNATEFGSLMNIPGHEGRDWGSNIGSIEVGACSTAEVFEDSSRKSAPITLEPGYSSPNAEKLNFSSIGSIRIYCTCSN